LSSDKIRKPDDIDVGTHIEPSRKKQLIRQVSFCLALSSLPFAWPTHIIGFYIIGLTVAQELPRNEVKAPPLPTSIEIVELIA
jgi:hypothetical protein